eukprot:GILI01026482.1.p1 GENE.GILI01026482.1~~GILI01026482.1.p1  ORF type:complete len:425 (+),score=51.33 GILI01026482.1:30-1277(+)
MGSLEPITNSESFYRHALMEEEKSQWWHRLGQPITLFKIKVLQATNSVHSPHAEPVCRQRLEATEFRHRVAFAVHFVYLRICWEEEWERLRFTLLESFFRNQCLRVFHELWIEEASEWEDLLYVAEPFREMISEVHEEHEKAETIRRNKLLWLHALKEREIERRRELEYHRDEFVLLERLEASQRLLQTQERYLSLAMGGDRGGSPQPMLSITEERASFIDATDTLASGEGLSPIRSTNAAQRRLDGFVSYLTNEEDKMWREADASFGASLSFSALSSQPSPQRQPRMASSQRATEESYRPTRALEYSPRSRPADTNTNASQARMDTPHQDGERYYSKAVHSDAYSPPPPPAPWPSDRQSPSPGRSPSLHGQALQVPLFRRAPSTQSSSSVLPLVNAQGRSPLLVPLRKASRSLQ